MAAQNQATAPSSGDLTRVPMGWPIAGVFKDAGVVAVLIWFLWYTNTVTLPTTQKDFHDMMGKEREIYRSELKEQRTHDEKRNGDLIKGLSELTGEIRKLHSRGGGS